MTPADPLGIPYHDHDRVRRLVAVIRYCLEDISLSFDSWESPGHKAPGAYIAVVSGWSVASYADAMGDNRWPEYGRDVLADIDAFYDAARRVTDSCDGAVVVGVDGVVNEQLVRFRSPDDVDVEYEPWMGARHMSALDISTREDVVATLTLSQENGRVSAFENGTFESERPETFASEWRTDA